MVGSLPGTSPEGAELPGTLTELHAYLVNELTQLPQVVNPPEKASVILELVCNLSPHDLLMSPLKSISIAARNRVDNVLNHASKGMPLAYALGEWFFAGRRFLVDSRVLIPRPDTEILFLAARDLIQMRQADRDGSVRALEIGTGSGVVIISLAAELPYMEAVATDISAPALAIARRNAEHHNVTVRFVQSDLFTAVDGQCGFDLILSNPPYVSHEAELEPVVLEYEPREALLVPPGETGTYFHRLIAAQASDYLEAGGWLLLEVGIGQAEEVAATMERAAFDDIQVSRDLGGIERAVKGRWSG